ncbi:MAG: histidine kinase [Candidatus Nanopelagicales bacterium]|nr:histidine kinase [Candidatus Nanopelagicales bacterium]MCU0295399.1 histidine kinase [Candidatus Nanopelagicales bacterium]MCU0298994.1 histidine kinase [Candidatus Nanopelagicales bacterium]
MASWTHGDRAHQRQMWWVLADAVLAGLFTWITVVSLRSEAYVDQYGPVEGAGWVLALAPNALLLVRRFVPVTALVTATALYLVASATQGDSNAPLAIPFFAYSVALARSVRVSGLIVGGAALALSTATFYGPGEPDPLVIVVWFLLFGVGWLVGISIRANQSRAEQLTLTVDHLEAHQQEVAQAAIADERIRIARELHDAVGHAVNVMVLQAGAARLSNKPEQAFEALGEIETLGRDALTDLDHMLGLLEDTGPAERNPAKGIADIQAMVDELCAAGADIELHNECDKKVGHNVGTATFRIAQEALTNALKHAPGSHVVVSISCTASHLHLSIVNDGSGVGSVTTSAGGRGIVGMTERAKILGGQLQAGPAGPAGFAVRATLPLGPAPLPTAADSHRATA